MAGEHRPRTHRLVNPEQCAEILRRIVAAWDAAQHVDSFDDFDAAMNDARKLLNPVAAPYRESGEPE